MRILNTILLAAVLFAVFGGIAWALDGPAAQEPSPEAGNHWPIVGAGISLAIAAAAGAIGQSRAIAASVESIARQPEAGGRIFVSMIIGLALIETLVIYTLVIAFMMLG